MDSESSRRHGIGAREIQRQSLVVAHHFHHVAPVECGPVHGDGGRADRRVPSQHDADRSSKGLLGDERFVTLHVEDHIERLVGRQGRDLSDPIRTRGVIGVREDRRDSKAAAGIQYFGIIGGDDAQVSDAELNDALMDPDHQGDPSEQSERLSRQPRCAETRRNYRQDRHRTVDWGVVAAKFTPCKIRTFAREGKRCSGVLTRVLSSSRGHAERLVVAGFQRADSGAAGA